MALPKIQEARELDDQALDEAIVATRRRLFDLRFQKAIRKLESEFHQFKHERHRLAQLMTVRRERMMAAEETEGSTSMAVEAAELSAVSTSSEPDAVTEEE